MKVLICGSRNWTYERPIKKIIELLPIDSIVIVGGAKGADLIAQNLAEKRSDLNVKIFSAKWDLYGKRAGPMRNLEMLNEKPDIVYAFPLGESRGTYFTTGEAKKRGICTVVYGEDD